MDDKFIKKVEKAKEKLTVNKNKLGKAGEYLVAGKLLMNGFSVYMETVDSGMDLVAKKSKKFYYFQVKTCQDVDYDSGKFVANINIDTLKRFPETRSFIVFVFHYLGSTSSVDFVGDHNLYEETYITIPVKDLLDFLNVSSGHVSVRLRLSWLMSEEVEYSAAMFCNKKKLVLDEYLYNGFWQVEI